MRCSLCEGKGIVQDPARSLAPLRYGARTICSACGGSGIYVYRDLKPANMIQRELDKLGGAAALYPGPSDASASRPWFDRRCPPGFLCIHDHLCSGAVR